MIDIIFLDRDGIVNEVVMRGDVGGSPRTLDEFRIREDFSRLYQKLISCPFRMIVVSNQPDVRRNLMSQGNLDLITSAILEKFPKLEFMYCIHDDRDQCSCRKPKPGMLTKGLKKYELSPERAVMIGDSYKDVEAGRGAEVKTVLLRTSYNREEICTPDFTINDLSEVDAILGLGSRYLRGPRT